MDCISGLIFGFTFGFISGAGLILVAVAKGVLVARHTKTGD